jgi:predicted house-cleaning noncanonical NTP pyrophosphatase (MazG superfamily)
MRVTYDKLIRDRIPDVMDRAGVRYELTVLPDDAFRAALLAKAVEETEELRAATHRDDVITELADVLEVLDAVMRLEGIDVEEVRAVQAARREARGGFERRVMLRWTEG